jgi:cytochrome P450
MRERPRLTALSITTSIRRAAFWFIAYLLFNGELRSAIIEETAPSFHEGAIDQDYIAQNCPQFRAAYDEMLRISSFSSSVRYIIQDTMVGNKVLRKGRRIMMPYRQMHLDESTFGERVNEFVPDRFLKNPGLRKYNMAYGGGATMCPGRHFATQTVMVFVAMLFRKFHVTLTDPDQAFPKGDEAIPVLGIIDVKRSPELMVTLQKAQSLD